ncbi:hypothetical protein L596_000459 [Steinernema carpocapsae]|uniref:Uncharacterized protein n=1 Tax=Steinernema carpocapsae TaxID=34508 RepID=A0A4U8UI82_STECR|nr:hypothetical protein L596_000459 [Steinernema carpocapsae]
MCVQAGLNGDILVGTSLALLCFNNDGVYQRDVNLASSSNGPNGSNCTNGGSVRLSVPCCVVCPTTRSIVAVVKLCKKRRTRVDLISRCSTTTQLN